MVRDYKVFSWSRMWGAYLQSQPLGGWYRKTAASSKAAWTTASSRPIWTVQWDCLQKNLSIRKQSLKEVMILYCYCLSQLKVEIPINFKGCFTISVISANKCQRQIFIMQVSFYFFTPQQARHQTSQKPQNISLFLSYIKPSSAELTIRCCRDSIWSLIDGQWSFKQPEL